MFCTNKGSGIWFCTVCQLVIIYMCAKNKTLASQNSWLYAIHICQISHAEDFCPSLLIPVSCFFITTPVYLLYSAMVFLLLHESLNKKCCTDWSGICCPAVYTEWSQYINKISVVLYRSQYCNAVQCCTFCSLILLQRTCKKAVMWLLREHIEHAITSFL